MGGGSWKGFFSYVKPKREIVRIAYILLTRWLFVYHYVCIFHACRTLKQEVALELEKMAEFKVNAYRQVWIELQVAHLRSSSLAHPSENGKNGLTGALPSF